MVQVINPGGTFGSQFGAGIGRGLSEQLPQEIQRYRLSSGIEKLKKMASTEGTEPIDLVTESFTIPGMTPEMAAQLYPYLLSAAQQSEWERAKTAKNQPIDNQKGTSLGTASGAAPALPGVQAIDNQVSPHKEFRRLGTPEAITSRGTEFSSQNPLRYPTQEAGEKAATQEFNSQQANLSKVASDFDKILGTKLQKGGDRTYSDVLGDLQNDFRIKAEDDVLTGKLTPEEAAHKYTTQALNFAKAKSNLDRLGFSSIFNPKNTMQSIDAIKKEYEKYGRLEEFKDEIISKFGLTDQNASQLVYPLKNNKELDAHLNGIPAKIYPHSSKAGKGKATSDEDVADYIADHIDTNDSIFSMIRVLENKNYVPEEITGLLLQKWKNGKIKLNERQVRELQKPATQRPSLGDFFLFKMAGKDVIGE